MTLILDTSNWQIPFWISVACIFLGFVVTKANVLVRLALLPWYHLVVAVAMVAIVWVQWIVTNCNIKF